MIVDELGWTCAAGFGRFQLAIWTLESTWLAFRQTSTPQRTSQVCNGPKQLCLDGMLCISFSHGTEIFFGNWGWFVWFHVKAGRGKYGNLRGGLGPCHRGFRVGRGFAASGFFWPFPNRLPPWGSDLTTLGPFCFGGAGGEGDFLSISQEAPPYQVSATERRQLLAPWLGDCGNSTSFRASRKLGAGVSFGGSLSAS